MRDTILWCLRAQECARIDCDTKYEWISNVKLLIENWRRFLNEKGPREKYPGKPFEGGNRFAYFKDDFRRRLAKVSPQERQEVTSFIQGLLGMGEEPAEWSDGEREQTLDDITDFLQRQSDPGQEQVSDEELAQMRLPPDFVLLRMDNERARALMKSIRLLLELTPEEQEEAAYTILGISAPEPGEPEPSREKEQIVDQLIDILQGGLGPDEDAEPYRKVYMERDIDSLKGTLERVLSREQEQ